MILNKRDSRLAEEDRGQTGLAGTEKGVPLTGFDFDDVPNWRGRDVIDQHGYAVGVISDIYVDHVTGRPEWAAVKSGLFSHMVTFVPLSQARQHGLRVQLPYDKDHIQDAPHMDPDGQLSADEEARLYQHYGVDYSPAAPGTAPVGTRGPAGPSEADSEFIVPATDKVDEPPAKGTGSACAGTCLPSRIRTAPAGSKWLKSVGGARRPATACQQTGDWAVGARGLGPDQNRGGLP